MVYLTINSHGIGISGGNILDARLISTSTSRASTKSAQQKKEERHPLTLSLFASRMLKSDKGGGGGGGRGGRGGEIPPGM